MSEQAYDNHKQEQAQSFSCPSCGARALFDPASQQLKCPYCGAQSDIQTVKFTPEEYDINDAPKDNAKDWGDAVRVVRCEGCGAEIVLDGETTSKQCMFCGSPHVSENQASAGIAPESVIPFRIVQKQAAEGFRKWLKRKLFAPGKVKKMAQLGEILGVYLPHWTYDADTTTLYRGQAGEHYYVTVPVQVTRNGKTVTEMRREQRTRWRPASGVVQCSFDDVLVAGSQRLSENLLSRVRPYDLKQLVMYQPAFLSGFGSEKPSVGVKEGWRTAQGLIDERMRKFALDDILRYADEARVTDIKSEHRNVKYKLTLLPMYLSAFQYKSKSYNVLVNGQTGRVGGQTPVSPWRVLLAVLLFAALCVGIYYLVGSDSVSSALDYMAY